MGKDCRTLVVSSKSTRTYGSDRALGIDADVGPAWVCPAADQDVVKVKLVEPLGVDVVALVGQKVLPLVPPRRRETGDDAGDVPAQQ